MSAVRAPRACHGKRGCDCAHHTHYREAARVRRAQEARERWGAEPAPNRLVDATSAREHVHRLRAQGMTFSEIGRRVGTTHDKIDRLATGRVRRSRREFIDAVLAVQAEERDRMPAVGMRRRLQGLMVMGWSLAQVAMVAGLSRPYLSRVSRGLVGVVSVENDLAVRRAARVLSARPCPSGRSVSFVRAVAARQGYVSLMAWDRIDDPRERPKGVAA